MNKFSDMWKKHKKKYVIVLAVIIILCVVNARFSLYKMESNALCNSQHMERDKQDIESGGIMYQYLIYKEGDEGKKAVSVSSNTNAVKYIAVIHLDKYQGNYYIPLYKNFSVKYNVEISNSNTDENNHYTIDGKMDGEIKFKIRGICSIRKVKDIVDKKVFEEVQKYLNGVVQSNTM